ncbi:MAG: hypothetical protein MUE41_07045 [Gemmatimonadaceae bacterium]|jgi:hypothetical protein|nr:hypothetical protein [Gemmatimonadaceae bacterium]
MHPIDLHALLLERFTTDATTLRERARGPVRAGPSHARSGEMADACDAIVALITATPADRDALAALGRTFDARAAAAPAATQPVWRGAATRVRELLALGEP